MASSSDKGGGEIRTQNQTRLPKTADRTQWRDSFVRKSLIKCHLALSQDTLILMTERLRGVRKYILNWDWRFFFLITCEFLLLNSDPFSIRRFEATDQF